MDNSEPSHLDESFNLELIPFGRSTPSQYRSILNSSFQRYSSYQSIRFDERESIEVPSVGEFDCLRFQEQCNLSPPVEESFEPNFLIEQSKYSFQK